MCIPSTVPATQWCVECAIDDEQWGYLTASGVATGLGEDRLWFATPEEAEAAASELRFDGWEAVKVQSNARY